MESNTAWEEALLPVRLRQSAYRAGEECAWNREDALEVLRLLVKAGYVVLGVDVWLATSPGPTIPTPFVYDWSLEDNDSTSRHQTAEDFIKTFEWDQKDRSHRGMDPYFNFTAIRNDG